ncbi:TraR/DksA C4-type zinc finger protein [Stenotrophomonas pigmentata]|uniref:hypothetical protein n=1 Tax=Stenotrophomonas pigmentata TaxID=3055080 RepID=UPI0026EEA4A2|nr:hypothetical protein [Stenotrophomonas sp. 610A2]
MPDAMDHLQTFNDEHVQDSIKRHQAHQHARAGRTHCERLDCGEPIRPERTAQGAQRCDECEEEHQRRNAHFAPWARQR